MSTIDKLQNDISTWYETSTISQFMQWWKTELKSFVPEKYQQLIFPQPIRVYLVQEGVNVIVWKKQNNHFEQYNQAVKENEEHEQWWHQVQHIINQAEGQKVLVKFLLPNSDALIRKIALPQAAKENLDEVIGFELDKYVPFNSGQVQLSYKIDKDNQNAEKILIDLAVIPKQKVKDILNLCNEKTISLDGLDINTASENSLPTYLGVNLLPQDQRTASDFFNLKLNLGLMVLLIGLIYFVMHNSLANKQNKIERITQINAELQKQARTSKLLRKELKTVIVSSKFLQNQKKEHPQLVVLLSDITTILPDATFISRLKVDQEKIEITGQSDNAYALVPKLDESKNWYVPGVVGSITKDPKTKKDKFTIKAALREPQVEGENDNNS